MPAKAGTAVVATVALGLTAIKLFPAVYRLIKGETNSNGATILERMMTAGAAQLESMMAMFTEAQRVKNGYIQQLSSELDKAKGEKSQLRQEVEYWKAQATADETQETQRLLGRLKLVTSDTSTKEANVQLATAPEQLVQGKPESTQEDLATELMAAKAEISLLSSKLQRYVDDTEAGQVASTSKPDVDVISAEVDRMVTMASGHVLQDSKQQNQPTAAAETGRKSLRVKVAVLEKELALLQRNLDVANQDSDANTRKLKEAEEQIGRRAAAWAKEKKKLQKKLQQYADSQAAAGRACTEAELLATQSGEALAQAQHRIVLLEGTGSAQNRL